MSDNKRPFGTIAYIVLFIFSFMLFLFMTFPYSVLKESIVSQIATETGISIRIREFGPSLPLGFNARQVSVTPPDGAASLELERAAVSVSVFRLLIGEVAVNVNLGSRSKGKLDAQASWKIFSLLTSDNPSPHRLRLAARNFEVGQISGFMIKHFSDQANDLIKGTLRQITLDGILAGNAILVLAKNDPQRSTGEINLELKGAVLDLNDPNLEIPPQEFSKALLKASLRGGRLALDDATGFHAPELSIDLNGSVNLSNPVENSPLDLGFDIKLSGSLLENFGFLLSMVGAGSEGDMRYKLTGSLEQPVFTSL